MEKIVINAKYGGFGLSHQAIMRYADIKGIKLYPFVDEITAEVWEKTEGHRPTVEELLKKNSRMCTPSYKTHKDKPASDENYFYPQSDIERNDPVLVQVVEEMGERANGHFASLRIVEIPDGIDWEIEEYDGTEWVAEKHQTWQ